MQRTKEGTLSFTKAFSQEDEAKRGKNPNISPTVTCTDIPASGVIGDYENVNDVNIHYSVNVSKGKTEVPESTVVTDEPEEP